MDTLLEHGANPSLHLSKGVGSALCAATSFMAERRRTPVGRIKLVSSYYEGSHMAACLENLLLINVVNKFIIIFVPFAVPPLRATYNCKKK